MTELEPIAPPLEIIDKLEELNSPVSLRSEQYNIWQYQLDLLWHDIDAGLFGDAAKTGQWYNHIKAVKDANPKVSEERETELKLEIQAIIEEENGD